MITNGQKLKNTRKNMGLTQIKLSEILGMSSRTICMWEIGKYELADWLYGLISYRLKNMEAPIGAHGDICAIRDLRKRLGLSQARLAKILGLHFKTIEAWEYGKNNLRGWLFELIKFYVLGAGEPKAGGG
jgi:transcriptional regulator with XRE-family HTH domain